MKTLTGYVKVYLRDINRIQLLITALILSILIIVNYYYHLSDSLTRVPGFGQKFIRFLPLFGVTFILTYVLGFITTNSWPSSKIFYLLLVIAPAIFAVKVSLQVAHLFPLEDKYLTNILQWPLKAVVTTTLVALVWKLDGQRTLLPGISAATPLRPYLLVLAIMLPIVLIAGLGADFQRIYPKLHMIGDPFSWGRAVIFEFCYGIDFFTIELFFRGFMILAFIKYVGKDAILPMAVFYCTIHFGKPVAECISSFFGGLILGAIVYNTRSVWGGLIIHLGIAWIMEMAGVLF